jgi:hypothetical protein
MHTAIGTENLKRKDDSCIDGRIVIQWTLDITWDGGDTFSTGVTDTRLKVRRPFLGIKMAL